MFRKIALTIALGAGVALPVATTAEAAMSIDSLNQAMTQIAPIEHTQFVLNGQQYCWYDGGWRGPGWYWCGYAWNNGLGWGGGYGWNGWRGGHRWVRGGFHGGGHFHGGAHMVHGGHMGGGGHGGGGGHRHH